MMGALQGDIGMFSRALIAIAALALGACATQTGEQTGAARDCFNANTVNGYTYVDENHVIVSVGASRKYQLTTLFNASELDWTRAIAIRSHSNWVCAGNGLGVEIVGGDPMRTYPVRAIERLPDEAPAPQGS